MLGSVQVSRVPISWMTLDEYLAANGAVDGDILLSDLADLADRTVELAAGVSVMSALCFLAARKPVRRKCQFYWDTVGFVGCFVATLQTAVQVTITVGKLYPYCWSQINGVSFENNRAMQMVGYQQFSHETMPRIVVIAVLLWTLVIVTFFAAISNWCGICCKCFKTSIVRA